MSTNTVISSQKAFVVNPTRAAIPEDSKAAMPKKLRPNFILEWGDGPNDQIETSVNLCLVIKRKYIC